MKSQAGLAWFQKNYVYKGNKCSLVYCKDNETLYHSFMYSPVFINYLPKCSYHLLKENQVTIAPW